MLLVSFIAVSTSLLLLILTISLSGLPRRYNSQKKLRFEVSISSIHRNYLSSNAQWRADLQRVKPLLTYVLPASPEEKRYVVILVVSISLCIGAGRLIRVGLPLLIGRILESLGVHATREPDRSFPWMLITSYVFARFFLQDLIYWISWTLSKRFDDYVLEKVNIATYNKIMSLSADYQDRKKTMSAWSTVTSSGGIVSKWVSMFIFELLPDLADLVFSVFSFGTTVGNAQMSMIMLSVLVCYSFTVLKTSGRSAADRKQWRDALEARDQHSSETISNWWTVSISGQVDREQRQYKKNVIYQREVDIKFSDEYWFNHNMKNLVMAIGLLWIWLLMTREIWQGTRDRNDLVMFIYIWAELTRPITRILKWDDGLSQLVSEVERLLDILKESPSIRDQVGAIDYQRRKGDINFQNVSFSYGGAVDGERKPGVRDVSITITRGSTVAIVGRSGGGKSTLLKLIKRSYDPDEGAILIDGEDVKHLTQSSLAAGIGLVPQNIGVFNDTFLNNVRYPRPNASIEECREACVAVGLEDLMDEVIGDNGSKLSGGQLQRLAIARVLVQQTDVLLLDEATSHLDSDTEKKVQAYLQEWQRQKAGRTIVMIAHSFRSIMNRDTCHIIAIKDGRVVEQGTESQLLSKKGYYHELYLQQVL